MTPHRVSAPARAWEPTSRAGRKARSVGTPAGSAAGYCIPLVRSSSALRIGIHREPKHLARDPQVFSNPAGDSRFLDAGLLETHGDGRDATRVSRRSQSAGHRTVDAPAEKRHPGPTGTRPCRHGLSQKPVELAGRIAFLIFAPVPRTRVPAPRRWRLIFAKPSGP